MNRTSCLCEHKAKAIDSNFRIFSLHFWARCWDNGDGVGDGHQHNTASSCSQLQTIHTDLHSAETMDDTLKGPTWD